MITSRYPRRQSQKSTMKIMGQMLVGSGFRFKVIVNFIYKENDSYKQLEDNMSVGVRKDKG